MKSRASIKSHPIHSMLIPFPFAFLTGGWAFGVAGVLMRNRDLTTVWRRLVPAGVAAGLVAAVPGIIDYAESVPPDSSAKSRAARHGVLNSTALLLFAAGWMMSRRSRRGPAVPLAVQGMGTAVLSLGAWLGGTLVVRNQIGVDHRYANSGAWDEETRGHAGRYALLSAAQGLGVNQMKLVHAGGTRIAVGRTEDGYAAFSDRCTHRGGPLSDGALVCGTVQCPWHGSQFDVRTGEVTCGPAEQPVKTYRVGDEARVPEGREALTSGAARHRPGPSRP